MDEKRHLERSGNSNADWQSLRQQMMLDPAVVNLNTGSFGPLPRCVFDRVTELRSHLAAEPMNFFLREAPPLMWQARKRLADFIGAESNRLVFTVNVTAAINTVAGSLKLAAPGEILMTDHEYGAMKWCWDRAAQCQGLRVRTIPIPVTAEHPDEITDAFVAAISAKTRLLFFSHVLSPTGLVLPAEQICREARRRGVLTMVDGAHAPAMVPLNLEQMQCDFYGGNCHKWLLAPTGSGFLFASAGNEDRLQPLQVSWGWNHDRTKSHERHNFGSSHWSFQFEFEGTRDPCPWLTVPEAISFQEQIGFDGIRQRNESLVNHAHRRLGQDLRLPLWTPTHPQLHGFMTTFRLPEKVNAPELQKLLWDKHRIEVPIIDKPYACLVRVSTHFYNNPEEIDLLADALFGAWDS